MSGESKQPQSAPKPMPTIERFDTGNPNLLGIGFETPVGSILLGAHTRMVREMIAKLSVAANQMREPS